MFRRTMLGSALALTLAVFAVSAQADKKKEPAKPAPFEVKDIKVRVSGPYVHENLTVFLLHSKDQDPRQFVTLVEGIDAKQVVVSEKQQEQVSELVIENKSDKFLFLQEGDRLQGGKQDRIIVTSLVLPPKSGQQPLPTFCCESGRWTLGGKGKDFGNVENRIQAPLAVRGASKLTPDKGGQGAVWDEVAKSKVAAEMRLRTANSNTSLNETLDSKQVKQICEACAKVLDPIPIKHDDVVGFALAINGRLEEVNVYPNADLCRKLYPRLVQSYALQAALKKDELKGKKAPEIATEVVEKFMDGKEKAKRFEDINDGNRIRIRELATEMECVTAFKGVAVHRQWINKASLPPMPTPKDNK